MKVVHQRFKVTSAAWLVVVMMSTIFVSSQEEVNATITPWPPQEDQATPAVTTIVPTKAATVVPTAEWTMPPQAPDVAALAGEDDGCHAGKHPFDEYRHKQKYRVAVHSIRGFDAAMTEYNMTFSKYLTETAGQRFDPPIEFEMVPTTFENMNDLIDRDEMDFFYANPSIYTCIGIESQASPVVTIISKLEVRGHIYDLDVFGGVMFTRADNDDINSIADFKDKIIGAGSIAQIMAGQMQFYVMQKAGVSYVNDPAQVVFAYNQLDVVNGVLDGQFDVGFVRTDTIERTDYSADLFKIIEPRIYVLDDGNLFPFLHSTPIYPEWPVAALPTVPREVVKEVQDALIHIGDHAKAGQSLEECRNQMGSTCDTTMQFPEDFVSEPRCDTTKELAEIAYSAGLAGKFAGFRTPRSYFEVRTMMQEAGFLRQDDRGDWACTRAETVYDGITCPAGHYKRNRDEYEKGCSEVGLQCGEGYDCFCRPCVKAHEVDIYEHQEGKTDKHLEDYYGEYLEGCDKMTLCGSFEQTKSITFRAFDNKRRDDAEVTVLFHVGDTPKWLPVKRINGTYAYEFTISEDHVGIEVFEVYVDGEQIPDSPIRVEIAPLDCDVLHGMNSNRVADDQGICVCDSNTYAMGDRCVKSPFFFVMIFGGIFIVIGILLFFYLKYKRKQSDSVWHINVDELVFDEPPQVIGQGAFGVVIAGTYRGTRVAVKRVLAPVAKKSNRASMKSAEIVDDDSSDPKDKAVRFGGDKKKEKESDDHEADSSDDVEAQTGRKKKNNGNNSRRSRGSGRSSMKSGSRSGSQSGSLGDLILPEEQKFDSVMRILESATVSSAGSDDLLHRRGTGYSTQRSSFLPLWLRFDEHSKLKRDFIMEMRLLSRLRHPCITTVMGAVISPSVDPMLVMEYMDYGSLYDLLHNETMYTGGETILQIIRDVTQGIRFLHSSKPPILHGDLKAKNILVDSRFRAKVADFGLSHFKPNTIQGTPVFMAPEYLRRKTEYTTACDMYSLAMIVYEIYARRDPFEGEDIRKILPKVCHPRINLRPPVPEACPPKMADIMKKLWSANPFFRPAAKDLDYIFMDLNAREVEPLEKQIRQVINDNKPQKTAKELLYDVFPKHIADALNAGQRVEPEQHDEVTIVFSDIVGFTDISSTFSPLQVSQMLDRLYQAFDTISRKHKVFKVETIGDAYMGVTNLDKSQADEHVKNIAEYAIEIIAAASQILIDENEPERGTVQIRVGFHSGPVVSNVIGTLNPRYGLFGDTVNTASRMESNSAAGKILCSQSAAKLLEEQAPHIPLQKRGKINVKGKGTMLTYWVGTDPAMLGNSAGLSTPKHSMSLSPLPSSVPRTYRPFENAPPPSMPSLTAAATEKANVAPAPPSGDLNNSIVDMDTKFNKSKTTIQQQQDRVQESREVLPQAKSTMPLPQPMMIDHDDIKDVPTTFGKKGVMVDSNQQKKKQQARTLHELERENSDHTHETDDVTHDHSEKHVVHHDEHSEHSSNSGHQQHRIDNLVNFDVELLASYLRLIVAKRRAQRQARVGNGNKKVGKEPAIAFGKSDANKETTVVDEVVDSIAISEFDPMNIVMKKNHHDSYSHLQLDEVVMDELEHYVSIVASLYTPRNPFHNFEHANHALISVEKLIRYMVSVHDHHQDSDDDDDIDDLNPLPMKVASNIHYASYGIASDPLAQFACIFSTLIHDVDHPGLPNMVLVKEHSTLAKAYHNKSVAEQNSFDICWEIFLTDRYANLRDCMFGPIDTPAHEAELLRFRQLVINMVMATDIMDKNKNAARRERWNTAFELDTGRPNKKLMDIRATLVLEHLLQVSDVSHTMQDWDVYIKWNKKLFFELYGAYKKGHALDNDPSVNWYKGEIGFFDFYIIPLAQKLEQQLDKHGESNPNRLRLSEYAKHNRDQWEQLGEELVESYVEKYDGGHH